MANLYMNDKDSITSSPLSLVILLIKASEMSLIESTQQASKRCFLESVLEKDSTLKHPRRRKARRSCQRISALSTCTTWWDTLCQKVYIEWSAQGLWAILLTPHLISNKQVISAFRKSAAFICTLEL